jgi:hypothetical protein
MKQKNNGLMNSGILQESFAFGKPMQIKAIDIYLITMFQVGLFSFIH